MFSPDWQLIVESDIWQEQIVPWLAEMRQDALEEKANPVTPIGLPEGVGVTLEHYHYWRGAVAVLKVVMDYPATMIEIERAEKAQEQVNEAVQPQSTRRRSPRAY